MKRFFKFFKVKSDVKIDKAMIFVLNSGSLRDCIVKISSITDKTTAFFLFSEVK